MPRIPGGWFGVSERCHCDRCDAALTCGVGTTASATKPERGHSLEAAMISSCSRALPLSRTRGRSAQGSTPCTTGLAQVSVWSGRSPRLQLSRPKGRSVSSTEGRRRWARRVPGLEVSSRSALRQERTGGGPRTQPSPERERGARSSGGSMRSSRLSDLLAHRGRRAGVC